MNDFFLNFPVFNLFRNLSLNNLDCFIANRFRNTILNFINFLVNYWNCSFSIAWLMLIYWNLNVADLFLNFNLWNWNLLLSFFNFNKLITDVNGDSHWLDLNILVLTGNSLDPLTNLEFFMANVDWIRNWANLDFFVDDVDWHLLRLLNKSFMDNIDLLGFVTKLINWDGNLSLLNPVDWYDLISDF